MKSMLSAVSLALLPITAAAAADESPKITPAASRHFERAHLLGYDNGFDGMLTLCNAGRPEGRKWPLAGKPELRGDGFLNGKPPAPAQIFDNFYYLGATDISAYALSTPDGIVVIDTLNNGKQAESQIADGLRHFGLDPARIRAIVVTHGHGDHYGGAAELARAYHAPVMMSASDWALAPTTRDHPEFDAAPPHDQDITDGQVLRLGNEAIHLYITPGHTPGTVSLLIPVTDHGLPHVIALWGGTGFTFPPSPDRFAVYAQSARRFAALAKAAGADVFLATPPEIDSVRFKLARLADRRPDEANPFVIGRGQVARAFTILSECAMAYGGQLNAR